MMIMENADHRFKKKVEVPEEKQELSSIKLPRWRLGWPFRLYLRHFPKSRLGQAEAEVAILGSLILVVFSVLITYGQRLDSQVEIKMEAFRKALNRAYARNASVSYTLKKDKRFYNLMGNFGESQANTLAASAMVMWQKGVPGCQDGEHWCVNDKDYDGRAQSAFAYYEVNNQLLGESDQDVARLGPQETPGEVMIPRYVKRTRSHQGDWSEMKVPASVWKDETRKVTNFTTIARKEENKAGGGLPSTIDNKQTAILNENIYTKVYVRYDIKDSDASEAVHNPQYIYSGVPPRNSVPLWSPSVARQGAWFNDAAGHNRVEYDDGVPEEGQTTRWRNWQTKF